jgi:hypothetical protein
MLVAGCGSDDDSSSGEPSAGSTTSEAEPSNTTADERTVEEAIAAHFLAADLDYAGDCDETNLEEDIGKHCSKLEDDRGTTRIYAAGPTFSEFDRWLLLEKGPEGWTVVDEASAGTLDDPQPPPW